MVQRAPTVADLLEQEQEYCLQKQADVDELTHNCCLRQKLSSKILCYKECLATGA